MITSRTLRSQRPSSSTDNKAKTVTIDLHVPASWGEMTQQQLRYTLWLLVHFADHTVVKTYMFCRFAGVDIIRKTRYGWKCKIDGIARAVYIKTWEIQEFIHQLDYIDSYDSFDGRLDAVDGYHATDVLLQGVTFETYLNAEKYYQNFQQTKDDKWIACLACQLYEDDEGNNPDEMALSPEETLGTMLWYAHVKQVLSHEFKHFFRPAPSNSDEVDQPDYLEIYNNELRALTGGDITKEEEVLQMDTWRALTELDAKAREAEELEKIRNRHK